MWKYKQKKEVGKVYELDLSDSRMIANTHKTNQTKIGKLWKN